MVVELAFTVDASQTTHPDHVVTCLDGPVDTDKLSLQTNIHDIHIDIDGVLAVWINRLIVIVVVVLMRILSHYHIRLVLWADQILLLAVHL